MIKYNLKCKNNHEFESWFSNSEEFDKLNKKDLLECIYCSSKKISKSIMSPRILNLNTKKQQVNLINKDIETIEMKILSFHNTNQLLQKITKFQLNTLDFDKLIKNTTPNNIHKLVNITFKMYEKFCNPFRYRKNRHNIFARYFFLRLT